MPLKFPKWLIWKLRLNILLLTRCCSYVTALCLVKKLEKVTGTLQNLDARFEWTRSCHRIYFFYVSSLKNVLQTIPWYNFTNIGRIIIAGHNLSFPDISLLYIYLIKILIIDLPYSFAMRYHFSSKTMQHF
jgi:hypothetical protein